MLSTIGDGEQDCNNGCSERPRQRGGRFSVKFYDLCLGARCYFSRRQIVIKKNKKIYVAGSRGGGKKEREERGKRVREEYASHRSQDMQDRLIVGEAICAG